MSGGEGGGSALWFVRGYQRRSQGAALRDLAHIYRLAERAGGRALCPNLEQGRQKDSEHHYWRARAILVLPETADPHEWAILVYIERESGRAEQRIGASSLGAVWRPARDVA